ncbi:MAG: hypothetical protein R3D53_13515 [Paracoccaceae bacterium]
MTPALGWRAFVQDRGLEAICGPAELDRRGHDLLGPAPAHEAGVLEVDHVIGAGPVSASSAMIPGGVLVLGVTARVIEAIEGSLNSWSLGNAGAEDRFGSGLGVAAGSWARGLLSQPMAYWAPEALQLTAAGGSLPRGAFGWQFIILS